MRSAAEKHWTVANLANMIRDGEVRFDNAVQRSLCWDAPRKSLLIDSILRGYPIPQLYATLVKPENKAKVENEGGEDNDEVTKEIEYYDMLDGKQRCNAIYEFIADKFSLADDAPELILDKTYEVAGLCFSKLPEKLQDIIRGYSLCVNYFDDISSDEIDSLFMRLNNGKPLTPFELTRVSSKAMNAIRRIASADFFKSILTEKGFENYSHEEIALQSWVILNVDRPDFTSKALRPMIDTIEVTDEHVDEIDEIYFTISTLCENILETGCKNAKAIVRRIKTKTHLVSLMPMMRYMLAEDVKQSDMQTWLMYFFDGGRATTISKSYNDASKSGSAQPQKIKCRLDALRESFEEFQKKLMSKPA